MESLSLAMQGKQNKFNAAHTRFHENTARENGGAIFLHQADFNGLFSLFSQNAAILSGGAVCIEVCFVALFKNEQSILILSNT